MFHLSLSISICSKLNTFMRDFWVFEKKIIFENYKNNENGNKYQQQQNSSYNSNTKRSVLIFSAQQCQ